MRSNHAFAMSYDKILSLILATCILLIPLHDCMGAVDGMNQQMAKTAQNQSTDRLTRLDLSRITFNGDIAFLSSAEQKRYRDYQSEFLKSLKRLPSKQQREIGEAYKWVPDVVKIIASRDYQDRKEYIRLFKPGSKFYSDITGELYEKRKRIPKFIEGYHVVRACERMIQFRYPMEMIDTKNLSIEDAAKKCGFGNLAKMVDFCNDPGNQGKFYNKSVDKLTYDLTLEEMEAFKDIGSKYERAVWLDFLRYPHFYIYKFWKFDLKRVDTSNLEPDEYIKIEKQLRCVPPEILINCRYNTYFSRTRDSQCVKIMKDHTYIKKYAQNKGIRLSEKEILEVYQLASELLKYGTPLKLVRRDEQADLGKIARDYDFYRVWGFYSYYKRKKRKNLTIKFYQSEPKHIPYFIAEAKDFYDLGMKINPEATKKLYQDIENDTGIIIKHQGVDAYINFFKDNTKQHIRD